MSTWDPTKFKIVDKHLKDEEAKMENMFKNNVMGYSLKVDEFKNL